MSGRESQRNDPCPGRREFLKSSLLTTAGATLLGPALSMADEPASASAAAESPASPAGDLSSAGIPVRPFGKTGRTLPILGMGGSAMVRMFIKAYGVELLPLDERVAMVRQAFDRGIRYFDTARVYGESEQIVGRGLRGVRDECYVATKCHATDPAKVRATVERSLKELDMQYVDCVQVHSPAIERVGFDGAMKLHAELVKLRDEGLVRFIGLTTRVVFETIFEMIKTGGFDQVLLAYGYFRKGMDTMLSNAKIEAREQCLATAHELGMAIVAMKVFGANILSHNSPQIVPDFDATRRAALPAAAIRWTLQDPRVSLLNIGVSLPSDIDQNVAILRGDLHFTNGDSDVLADFARRAYESDAVKQMQVT